MKRWRSFDWYVVCGQMIVKDPDALVVGPGEADGPWQVHLRYIRRRRTRIRATLVLPFVLGGYTSELLGVGIEPIRPTDPLEAAERERRSLGIHVARVRLVSWPDEVDVAELWGPGDAGSWNLGEPMVIGDGSLWLPTLPKETLLGFTQGSALAVQIEVSKTSDAYAVPVTLRLYSQAHLAAMMADWRQQGKQPQN